MELTPIRFEQKAFFEPSHVRKQVFNDQKNRKIVYSNFKTLNTNICITVQNYSNSPI